MKKKLMESTMYLWNTIKAINEEFGTLTFNLKQIKMVFKTIKVVFFETSFAPVPWRFEPQTLTPKPIQKHQHYHWAISHWLSFILIFFFFLFFRSRLSDWMIRTIATSGLNQFFPLLTKDTFSLDWNYEKSATIHRFRTFFRQV